MFDFSVFLILSQFSRTLSVVSALKNALAQNGEKVVEVEKHQLYAPQAHILVIDDNRMNIRVVEGLLKTYAVKVSYALSGPEGIEMLSSKEYDLILLDHMMPGMDGVETFHHIRRKADPYFKEIPIIALTANAIAGAREMFMKEGFTDFLSKPVESSVLHRTLKRHIPVAKQKTLDEKEKIEALKEQETQSDLELSQAAPEDVFVIGDLDIEKGLTYCGSKENYLEILASQRDSGQELLSQIENLFATEDWKNYTIAVHGIKSSMMSIGAVTLSELAKALEFAGKRDDIAFIQNEHAAMTVEFKRVMTILDECPYLGVKETQEETGNKPVISADEFDVKLVELENASYELDGDKMLRIIEDLSAYSFGGKDLQKELKSVHKKIEMFDFMSAYEAVAKIRKKA